MGPYDAALRAAFDSLRLQPERLVFADRLPEPAAVYGNEKPALVTNTIWGSSPNVTLKVARYEPGPNAADGIPNVALVSPGFTINGPSRVQTTAGRGTEVHDPSDITSNPPF